MSYGSAPPPPPSGAQIPPVYAPAPVPPLVPRKPRKRLAWIIVGAALGAIALVVLFIVGIMAVVFGAIKSSEPYKHAVEVATHDRRVIAALGPPVKPVWLPSGSINVNNASGRADLAIRLEGSARRGTVYVIANRSERIWSYRDLAVRVDDSSERIDLLPPASLDLPVH